MSRHPRPSLRRTLSSLPDKYVDPVLSEKRRRAAQARWAKQRGDSASSEGPATRAPSDAPQDPPQAAASIPVTTTTSEQAKPQRLATLGRIVDALPEAASTVQQIMRDAAQPGQVRLAAARTLLELGGMHREAERSERPPLEEMTLEQLTEFLGQARAELARLRGDQPIDLEQMPDGTFASNPSAQGI